MSELKQHEVKVKNEAGDELVCSAEYYARNKHALKMVDDNGWADKMDKLDLKNKSATKVANHHAENLVKEGEKGEKKTTKEPKKDTKK